jgi:hypothetical protein
MAAVIEANTKTTLLTLPPLLSCGRDLTFFPACYVTKTAKRIAYTLEGGTAYPIRRIFAAWLCWQSPSSHGAHQERRSITTRPPRTTALDSVNVTGSHGEAPPSEREARRSNGAGVPSVESVASSATLIFAVVVAPLCPSCPPCARATAGQNENAKLTTRVKMAAGAVSVFRVILAARLSL